ncbi:MAG: DNA polymerase IV [Candidatus Merdousia sp.]|nr:DNA polymerase IV [Candidatus Merdousia sp.]
MKTMPADRTILHCDLNGFYASVEALAHPEIGDKPMAVSGNPRIRHGIILAKNEAAKKYGISTGEPIFQAKKKCPNLILLEPHHEKYAEYSRRVNEIYSRFTNRVEPFGIDESWLDVSGSLSLFGSGVEIADKLRETVKSELGLTISVGVSFNKVFAKLGSDYKKPDATTLFGRGQTQIIRGLPVRDMLFVGRSTAETLRRMGIQTIGDLADADENFLIRRFGKHGKSLSEAARGEENSPVAFYGEDDEAKSVGNSITFKRDLDGAADIRAGLELVAEKVARRMKRDGVKCTVVHATIKGADFSCLTRQTTVDKPTNSRLALAETAMRLVSTNWDLKSPIRMLGIAGSGLVDANAPYQADLFEPPQELSEKNEKAEDAFFDIREKFGKSAISFGSEFERKDRDIDG